MWSPLRRLRTVLPWSVGLVLCCASVVAAQGTGTVRGTVTDAVSKRPVDGVSVFVTGTDLGTLTNSLGQFQLNLPAGQVELRVRRVGYGTTSRKVTVTAGEVAQADFEVSQVAIGLDAVVVTGVGGSAERRKVPNTVATINTDNLRNAPVVNVSEQLAAREPGVTLLPSGGLAGEGARIRIRGAASLSQPNEPVVYVDGVRVDRSGGWGDFVGTGGGGNPSRIDDINPEAVERIEVLKGAAAATLYGTEASAGVIQIFTRTGSRGAPRFDFTTEQGVSNFPNGRYEPNYGFARDASDPLRSYTRLNSFYGLSLQPYQVFSRPFVTSLFETGYTSNYSGSVSGGTAAVTYYVNGRFQHENGPWGAEQLGPARDFDQKAQGSASLQLFPADNVKIRVNTEYVDAHHETPSNNNNIFGTISVALFGHPERAECFAGSLPTGTGNCTVNGNPNGPIGPGNPYGSAAFATERENMQERLRQDAKHFTGSINVAYQPWQALSVEGTLGVDVVNQVSSDFAPFGYNVDQTIGFDPEGYKFLDDRTRREITAEFKATWNRRLGDDFASTFVGGGQGFIAKLEDAAGSGELFPGPGLEVIGAGALQTSYERFLETVNVGVFGQEQLGYKDYVFVTLGGRYDKNSAFGRTSQGVFYPKAGISFVPTSMPNWGNSGITSRFSTLRIRLAVGQSGLQPGAFDKLTTYSPLASVLGPGLAPNNLGNPDLKPEITTEWEAGTEIGVLHDRAALDFTYWKRVTRDALYPRQFAPSGGFRNVQLSNVGRIDSHGLEINVTGLPVNRPSFSVKVFANAAYLHEIVTSLGGAPPLKVGGSYPRYRNFVKEGYAPNSLFGAKLVQPCSQRPAGATYACLAPGQNPYDLNGDGNFDTDADMLAWLAVPRTLSSMLPIRVDENGNGDFLDHYLGKSTPDWAGSFGMSATLFRNFELSNVFEYKTGNYTITNLTFAFRNSNAVIGRNSRRAATVEATITNPASTAQQRVDAAKEWLKLRALTPYDGLNQNENGKFLRWRELSLTYHVPGAVASRRLGLRHISFTVSVRNLALWTGYTGIDPELNEYGRGGAGSDLGGIDNNFGEGIDAFGLALPRRITFSTRFGF